MGRQGLGPFFATISSENLQSGVHNLRVLSPVEIPVPHPVSICFLRTASPQPQPGVAGSMRARTFSAFSPGSSSPTAEVLNQEQFCPTGDTRQRLGTFVVVTTQRGSWHGVGGDQRCCSTRYHAQDGSTPENNPALKPRAEAKKPKPRPWSGRNHAWSTGVPQ